MDGRPVTLQDTIPQNLTYPCWQKNFSEPVWNYDFRKRKLIDVQNIFHKMEQRTLKAAYKFYCDKELEDAHSAEADTIATKEVLECQLERYPDDLQNDITFLAEFSTRTEFLDYAGRIALNDDNLPVFNFGKHRGKPVAEILKTERRTTTG